MQTVSPSQTERARKIETTILRAIAEVGQAEIARLTNVSESTVSRRKEDRIGETAEFLAASNLKVVPMSHIYIDPKKLDAMMLLFQSAVSKLGALEILRGDE
jgi:hypothetical protein